MMFLAAIVLATTSIASVQATGRDYPSCDFAAQHALEGDMGGSIRDARQAHISVRANVLEADLGSARTARLLSQVQADRFFRRAEGVRHGADAFVKKQGFLSAAERATYDRELDAIAMRICRARP